MDIPIRQKISKETSDLNSIINQINQTYIQNTLPNNNNICILPKRTWDTSQDRPHVKPINQVSKSLKR